MSLIDWICEKIMGELPDIEDETTKVDPSKSVSPVINEIIKAFESGPIVSQYLSTHEISKLVTNTRLGYVTIEWFPEDAGGGLYHIVIDGNSYPYSNNDIALILKAAKKRAKGLFDEQKRLLEKRLENSTTV